MSGHRRGGLALFVLCAALYLVSASGTVPSIDIQQSLEVAVNLVRDGTVEVDGEVVAGGGAVRGDDGRPYAAHNPGMAVLFLPLAMGAGPATEVGALFGVASLVVPVVAAAGVVAFWGLQRRAGSGARMALVAALVYAFATLVWSYAHDGFDVGPTNAALVVALLALLTADDAGPGRRRRWLVASGAALGAALLLRVDVALVLPAFGLGALAVARRHAGRAVARSLFVDATAWVVPVLVALAVTGAYNALRFTGPFDTGHGDDPNTRFTGEVATGLAGWSLSPGKAVVLFAPPVALAALGWRRLRRRRPLAVGVAIGAAVPWLVFHAGLANWEGDEAFGPRFVVPVLGLLLVPLGAGLEAVGGRRPAVAAAGAVVALGVAVQLLGVSVSAIPAARAAGTSYDAFAVDDSALLTSGRALARAARGDPPYPSPPGTTPPPRLDVWWLRDDPVLRGPRRTVLLIVVVAGVATGTAGVVGALRAPVGRSGRGTPTP